MGVAVIADLRQLDIVGLSELRRRLDLHESVALSTPAQWVAAFAHRELSLNPNLESLSVTESRGLADPLELSRVFAAYGFPQAPALQHYCARREFTLDQGLVSIDAFATSEPREQLVQFYQTRLGDRGLPDAGQTHWRLSHGAPMPTRELAIADPTSKGLHEACFTGPPETVASLVVLIQSDTRVFAS